MDKDQEIAVLRTRAETAESALRDAKKLLELYRAKRAVDGGDGREWHASKHYDAEELIAEAERALLTVAAQTPPTKEK